MYRQIVFVFIAMLLICLATAQEKKHILLPQIVTDSTNRFTPATNATPDKYSVPQKDLADVMRQIFGRKADTSNSNKFIVKPVISVVPAIGYTLQSRLAVTLAGNMAFRTSPNANLSIITASAAYTQNKQFTMPIESSIWSKNNRYNFVGDLRFYKYPQSTFGLGSSSLLSDEDPMDYNYFRFYEVVLRKLTGNFYAGAGYLLDYHWNISHQVKPFVKPNSYAAYGTASHTVSSGLTFNLLNDSRDNSIHPMKGMYASMQYRTSLEALGSTANWHSVILDIRKYYRFPEGSKNVVALWSYNWLILGGTPPYLELPSTSWDAFSSTGRGYIQGRFRGTKMVYGETEYRYGITRNGLFGGVVFVNAQSLAAGPGTSLQKVQPGFGAGLRIKLNKVSNTNISIDYGFGTQGSKGLFINVGELF